MENVTIFKHVKVYDGSGGTPFISDVCLYAGKIKSVGQVTSEENANVINGEGLCLAPGFIDVHTHSDNHVFVDPDRASKLRMGVTTEIGGQCGWSRAPAPAYMPDAARQYFQTVYSPQILMPFFVTFGEQLEAISIKSLGTNQACFVGHHYIRGAVLGMEDRAPTENELRLMEDLTEEAMQAGAMGLSTGLVYAPGCYAPPNEIERLAAVVARYGGIYTTHMRDEAHRVEEAVDEAINVAKNTGVRLNISHLKAMFPENWGKAESILNKIIQANDAGYQITFDVYPYSASSATSLSILPPSYLAHDIDWLMEHLTGERNIAALRDAFFCPKENWENPVKHLGLDKVMITAAAQTPEAIGMTFAQYAQIHGIDPVTAFADIIVKNHGTVADVRFCMSEEAIGNFYKQPICMVGSDAIYTSLVSLSHPRAFGTFTRFLGRYVRDKKLMPFEEGIRRITGMPADVYGLAGKGYIKEGFDADLVLFDENTITDHATYDNCFIPNEGITAVYVAGKPAVEEDRLTYNRCGKLIKRTH